MDPFISIVTVSLNAGATIEDTIRSVVKQQVVFPIEHICVDGGSTDATRPIIDRWAARAAHLRRVFEPDRGIYDAFNRGLSAARGEYVMFLNADDYLIGPDILARAMAGLAPSAGDNPELVLGDVVMGADGSRGVWRDRRVPRLLGRLRGCGLFPVHQGMFCSRRLLLEAGGFDPHVRLGSDVSLYYDLERRFRPRIRLLRMRVAYMRPGGAANANLDAVLTGSQEIFQHLAPRYGPARAALMVLVKTLQSLSEVRYGRCPQERWFD